MFTNYYQLETMARMQNQERLAATAKERLLYRAREPVLPTVSWLHWFGEQKAKWVAPRHPATIEPAC